MLAICDNKTGNFLILKIYEQTNKVDTLYQSKYEISTIYCNNDDIYFNEKDSQLIKLNAQGESEVLFTEPSGLYNGISGIIINEKLGIITINSTDNLVRIYTLNGEFKFLFGGEEYFGREPEDYGGGLVGFDIDEDLNIYTVDWVDNKVLKFKYVKQNDQIISYIFDKQIVP